MRVKPNKKYRNLPVLQCSASRAVEILKQAKRVVTKELDPVFKQEFNAPQSLEGLLKKSQDFSRYGELSKKEQKLNAMARLVSKKAFYEKFDEVSGLEND